MTGHSHYGHPATKAKRAGIPGLLAILLAVAGCPLPADAQRPDRPPGSSFLTGPALGDPLDVAMGFVRRELPGKAKSSRGAKPFAADDFKVLKLRDRVLTKHNGLTHLYLQQEINGLPVYQADIQAHVARDGSIVALHNHFASTAVAPAPSAVPILTAAEAVTWAARNLALPVPPAPRDLTGSRDPKQARFLEPAVSLDPIPAKLLYHPLDDGGLRVAWNLIIRTPDRRHWLDINIDGITGATLSQADWVFDAAGYKVTALPLEGPGEGPRTLVSGAEDTLASPFGWHDTNGSVGAEFTDTRGNNVQAGADPSGNNSSIVRPSGGASLIFDFPADFNQPSASYQSASVTSLFYFANVAHDIFYRYGFDEAAGNFQANNYARGGIGSDAVLADAQDSSSLGNASFSTPADGSAPRMTMGLTQYSLTVTAPASIAGGYPSTAAAFGAAFPEGMSGIVVQATDDTLNGASPTDCCGAITNAASISGKVALIDRGVCDFAVKVKNAQLAGAIAAVIVNNAGDGLVSMTGNDGSITIPSTFIGQGDGQKIKDALAQGVGIRFRAPTPDTAFDATIAIHEYAHGVTNRLTGGPANASALSGLIPGGLGEGWSDFFALAFTAKTADTATSQRLIGQYSFGAPGLRTKPYTNALSANPLTYHDARTRPGTHDLGEIWAIALWEMYWNLVEAYGFSPNLRTGTGGNNLALQLVVDGCKLQPSRPNFIQARDAILQADLANNSGKNQFAIWQAFARRGLGLSATAGTTVNDNLVTAAFDVPDSLDSAKPAADGVPNLLKAAFRMNLIAPAGAKNMPEFTFAQVGPSRFPAIRFKQLAGGTGTAGIDYRVNGINYAVEVSDDLVTWKSGAAFVTPVSTTPDADGLTDTVIVRSLTNHRYFRIRVTRSVTG